MLPRITPINPSRIAAAFDHEDWLFELKHGGFRAVSYIEAGGCQLVSRRNITYKSFPTLCKVLVGLRVNNAILDGEIVCLDKFGRSQFLELMHRKRQDAAFYAFDILWLDGVDLRSLPLIERKRMLRRVVHGYEGILYDVHVERRGVGLYEAVCQKDCEGIVAKHRDAPYTSTPATWFKVLNPDYTQKRGRGEMFEGFRQNQDHASSVAPSPKL